jgi:serine/threonine protein kinase
MHFLAVTRLIGLSLVLLVVNIAEGVVHSDRYSINILAAVASFVSLAVGAISAFDTVLRAVVTKCGFMALEWLQVAELITVSAFCTAIAVLTDAQGSNPVEVVSVGMALTTALLIRVDLTITVRVASEVYVERLLAAARDDPAARKGAEESLALSRSRSFHNSRNSVVSLHATSAAAGKNMFSGADMNAIEPPRVSLISVAAVHFLAALALPAPLIGSFIQSRSDGAVIGHLVAILILAWIRVVHSFYVAWLQISSIQSSTHEDEQLHDLAFSMPHGSSIKLSSSRTLPPGKADPDRHSDEDRGGEDAGPHGKGREPFHDFDPSATSLTAMRQFGLGLHNAVLSRSTESAESGNTGLTREGTRLLTTLSTTQRFRNKALSLRNRNSITAVVHTKKPNYRRGMVIGRGGFSTVFAAMNTQTGELMAAKRITFPVDDEHTDERMAMLHNEVTMMRALDHPHVVKYLFCDQPEPDPNVAETDVVEFYIVMEYVGGGSLRDLVKNFGALEEEAAACFVAQILLGIEYLHNSGRVHRDIKPANVLCRCDGHVKLSDFGTAADFTQSEEGDGSNMASGPVAGTPLYSPPESMRGKRDAARPTRDDELTDNPEDMLARGVASDIWALGCTVMELLTGKRPWYHLSSNALKALNMLITQSVEIEKHLDDDVWQTGEKGDSETRTRTVPTLPPGLSENATAFLESCLRVDPNARLNAAALLCHPWIRQFDLIDTNDSPLHSWVPYAVASGLYANSRRGSRLGRDAVPPPAFTPEQIAMAQAAFGGGSDSILVPLLAPATHDVNSAAMRQAMGEERHEYIRKREGDVRANMRTLVYKTRALMRLGVFKAASRAAATAEE